MAWFFLFIAGIFEMAFTTCLKLSDGFTKPWPIAGFLSSAVLSFWMLTLAMESIPLGTAYAVWTGIGAFGTAIIGIYFFGDATCTLRVIFLVLLIGSILGLKLVEQ
jgi:quaternary ammonium compound-resistance protein SugE